MKAVNNQNVIKNAKGRPKLNNNEIKINELIEKRNLLRDQGNYNDADKIRSQLDELGIILEDKDGKTSWKQKN